MTELVPLFDKWATDFLDKPQVVKNYLEVSSVGKEIARSVYQFFVNTGQIEPIEKADQQTKRRIWDSTKGKEERVKLAKVLYLFENVLQVEI